MKPSSNVRPIGHLKTHAAKLVRQLAQDQQPLIITQNGEARAVMQDVRSYEETQETLALLKVLALGNRQIEAGRFEPAREVFARLRNRD
jgi:prevent-host-death family protein